MLKPARSRLFLATALLGSFTIIWFFDLHAALFNQNLLQATQVIGEDFPLTLVDSIGETYKLNAPPQRIVSVTLGADEMLSTLVDSRRIAGITQLADLDSLSNVTGAFPSSITRINGDVEEILALEPDLVFVAAYTRAETIRVLLRSGIPVVRFSEYSSFAHIRQNIRLLAALTDSRKQAETLLAELQQRQKKVMARSQGQTPPRVLYYTLDGFSTGKGTLMDETISLAGGYNVLHDTGITGPQKISQEMAIGLQPEVILMGGWQANQVRSPAAQLSGERAWQNVPAVRNGKVFDLKGNWRDSVSQYSWDGLEQINKLLHSAFQDTSDRQPGPTH